jgi:hypothetical protein
LSKRWISPDGVNRNIESFIEGGAMNEVLLWLKEYGIAGGLIVVVIVGITKYFCAKFKQISKEIQLATGKITNIHIALSDADGKPITHHDVLNDVSAGIEVLKTQLVDHNSDAQKHYTDVARLADENKVKDCDVTKCLYVQQVTKEISSVIDRLNQFDEVAKESRGNTLTSLESIRNQITDLTRDLLATLRVFKGGAK